MIVIAMEGTFSAKSIVYGRKPRADPSDPFKTAFIKLFASEKPLLTEDFPSEEFDYANTEKIIVDGVKVEYYLEGNDMVIRGMENVSIANKDHVVTITFS